MERTGTGIAFGHIAAALSAAVLFTADISLGGQFTLSEASTGTVYGPFSDTAGSRVALAGSSYTVGVPGKGLMTFTATEGGRVYGPLKMVEGRYVVIGVAMYGYHSFDGAPPRRESPGSGEYAALHTPPPPKPEMIKIPEQNANPSTHPLDLPELPENERRVRLAAWFSPVDNTGLDWKINSAKGASSDLKRTAVGFGAWYDGFMASLSFMPEVKGGAVIDGGSDIDSVSVGDGDGFRVELGYAHPFLREGGWLVAASVRGVVERDSCNLNARTLVGTEVVEKEEYGADGEKVSKHTVYGYSNETSEMSITEFGLWLDFSISYDLGNGGCRAAVLIQPFGAFSVDGSIPIDDGDIDLKCDRKLPLGAEFGVWYGVSASVRVFADVSVGSDMAFKVGAGYEF